MTRTEFVVADQSVDWLLLVLPSPSTVRMLEAFAHSDDREDMS